MFRAALPILALACCSPSWAEAHYSITERTYCTQFGIFQFQHDSEKAAGLFSILANEDIGSFVGELNGHSFSGEWHEVDSSGLIEIEFTEDWAGFEARYTVAANPDEWLTGWKGRLPPEGSPDSFTHDETEYLCRR